MVLINLLKYELMKMKFLYSGAAAERDNFNNRKMSLFYILFIVINVE